MPCVVLCMSAEIKAAYSPYGYVFTMIRGRACDKTSAQTLASCLLQHPINTELDPFVE